MTLGTRTVLVPVKSQPAGLNGLRCAICGAKGFYSDGLRGRSNAWVALVTVYVAEGTPMADRSTAPAVAEGGIWARSLRCHPACLEALGWPYGEPQRREGHRPKPQKAGVGRRANVNR